MTVHWPVPVGTIGGIDPLGYGSWSRVWDYPTLGITGVILTTTTGGVCYPTVLGVRPTDSRISGYSPLQHWGDYDPTYQLPDGRRLVARLVDGQKCLVEE